MKAGVPIDSFLKRLVFGYRSGQFFEILFSDLITEETRVHYYRTPVERLERIIPFLYVDDDPFVVAADGRRLPTEPPKGEASELVVANRPRSQRGCRRLDHLGVLEGEATDQRGIERQ